jgi:hypothetical protein
MEFTDSFEMVYLIMQYDLRLPPLMPDSSINFQNLPPILSIINLM